MKRNRIVSLGRAISVILLGCQWSCMISSAQSGPIALSMIELMTEPSEYAGRQVVVKGFFAVGAGIDLFLTEDHALARDYSSAVPVSDSDDLSLSQSECVGRFVELIGTFIENGPNDFVLANVVRVRSAFDGEICWAAR